MDLDVLTWEMSEDKKDGKGDGLDDDKDGCMRCMVLIKVMETLIHWIQRNEGELYI
jgi:hypothetical protein